MAAPLIDQFDAAARCKRCSCLDCDRDGTGELHNHVCTEGSRCVERPSALKAENTRLRRLCGEALTALSRSAAVAHGVPADYALVPRVMSKKMRQVLHDVVEIECRPSEQSASILNEDAWWQAILAAALAPDDKAGAVADNNDVVCCEICEQPISENDLTANDEYGLIAHLVCPADTSVYASRSKSVSAREGCSCHPDDNPPLPCSRRHALSDCLAASAAETNDDLLDAFALTPTARTAKHRADRVRREVMLSPEAGSIVAARMVDGATFKEVVETALLASASAS